MLATLLDLPAERRHGLQPRGVASFCAQGDLLSQWRGYGEFGQGYSIGFDSGYFDSGRHDWVFVPVVYDSAKQSDLIREVVEYGCRVCDSEQLRPGAEMAALGHAVSNQLFFFSHFFKSDAFSEESEWRILQGPSLYQPDWSTLARPIGEFRIARREFWSPIILLTSPRPRGQHRSEKCY
ncbi:MAG: DUF2971 domain-containing protein [Bryobacterales bacterium]|nr:DUF2971 domain-containing protein [Bryobacterales bacterium]